MACVTWLPFPRGPYYTSYRHTSFYCTLLYCVSQIIGGFYKSKVCGNPAPSKSYQRQAILPTAHAHSMFQCHILVILTTFPTFSLYYYVCSSALRSVSYDTTIVIVWGHHEPHPDKTADLISVVRVPTALLCLLLLGSPYSLKHNNFEIRPIDNPIVAYKVFKRKQELLVSHFKSRTRMMMAKACPKLRQAES